jgi:hypothetical protein
MALSLNRLGGTLQQQAPRVSLPKFQLTDVDIEREAREAAARVAERQVIRAGVDAWQGMQGTKF